MSRLIILEEAARDLEEGRDFYDSLENGVGDYFTACLTEDLERLRALHGIHSLHFGLYRMLSARFPFAIYYREAPFEVQVCAILDLRREPTWIREELQVRSDKSEGI
ncbi:MAG TPA: hypothetical protein VD994_01710 [Prosthecobacter sp.]|nr:hypothetical protein [Prosthecobacter sp.]